VYSANARVYTIRMALGDIIGNAYREIPEFYVEAASAAKAEEKAKSIIDPLHMTGAEVLVKEIKLVTLRKKKKKRKN